MDIKCVYVYYICIFLRNREWYAECVYWTEPEATCHPHRNSAKQYYVPFLDDRGHINILWSDFFSIFGFCHLTLPIRAVLGSVILLHVG